ncbi:MAG TPA: septation protein SepH [Jatrophihabitantaceae bacterium]|jgi:hypothetical protein|nr:septation protein SepH [Jatrophihabitantaceae bacterium]
MRVLHFVERDAESGSVVLATSDGHEQFELAVDQPLRDALSASSDAPAKLSKPAMSRLPGEPRISPREIQMRVRAGEEPQELADTYGAGLDWVLRFAGPVLAERVRMADEARRSKARRSTTEGQTVVFGEAVDSRFGAHGIEPGTVRWDARRREDGQWIVSAHWIGGQTERTAEWAFHLAARTVAPVDDTAADLLSDRPIRPVATPEPPTLALVEFPPMPDAHTGPLPRPAEEVFDQAQFDEPHLPMHVPDLAADARSVPTVTNLGVATRDDETEDEKAARASIPSWDDILLGVRRKHD